MSPPYQRELVAVWELTLACNLRCRHCGSRAGRARAAELTTAEALDVVDQCDEAGVSEVSLIGGEFFLRRDWPTIASAVVERGMLCTALTGARHLGPDLAARIKDAGIAFVSVSLDGLADTHDDLRGVRGSWRHGMAALRNLRACGLPVGVNTQLNAHTFADLPHLYAHLVAAGVDAWQVQMTVPMGNAADDPELLVQPDELLEIFPVLARLACRARSDGMRFLPAGNVGYYGPYERLLRGGAGPYAFWHGPVAGTRTVGIESDGTVKPDASLPTEAYAVGNVRTHRLRRLLERSAQMRMTRDTTPQESVNRLWGFCRTCEFAPLCRGGDPWTAHVFFGRTGNNPYCHHRALRHHEEGVRECLTAEAPAGDPRPFDHRLWQIHVEPSEGPRDALRRPRLRAADVQWPCWPSEDSGSASDARQAVHEARRGLAGTAPDDERGWTDTFAYLREVLAAERALRRTEAAFNDDKEYPCPPKMPPVSYD